ncbi:hypothetical protein WSK_3339 [Novosphingobium sp. Rr 2-17]|uniref:DUF2332 domain-containing protein n=1 Tax=Novosphingobium sp. Rr 2-17 TaxID=555793 RepID=UPI0002699237|nr:DUF2332 family protein [Novosphingobium sp. Rr 2-17]EIZ78029.1 hypothetical protein WSK_3339 [Novosphingobium sp. Rr 2-17]
MNMYATIPKHGELWRHAQIARDLGSPFVAAVLEAGERQLLRGPLTAALVSNWPGDPAEDAMAIRFNAALHALARQGKQPELSALYENAHDDFDGAIGAALAAQDGFIASSMRNTPQTNEVGRSGAIAAALMVVGQEFGLPFELMEIGASCGLHLNLGHYGYQLATTRAGVDDSPVQIAPAWRGAPPAWSAIEIIAARGVDLNPLRANDLATRERLLSYVWADQPQRARRLEQALLLAQRYPPRVDRDNAIPWLAAQLESPQQEGTCRVVFHSMVLQYLAEKDRHAVAAMILQAGTRASIRQPLARISFEWTPIRDEVQLRLTCWPGGHTRLLATCHAYGDWVDWQHESS